RDAQAAVSELDGLATRMRTWSVPNRRYLASLLVNGYLSVGRVRDAQQAADQLTIEDNRRLFRARSAMFAGDLRAVRDEMTHVSIESLERSNLGNNSNNA